MQRQLAVWTARHDNGWTTIAFERPDGAFAAGAGPDGENPIVLDYVEDSPEHGRVPRTIASEEKVPDCRRPTPRADGTLPDASERLWAKAHEHE
jgi:hypothetical protein